MKFLFKKGFEVFNSERYAVANPIVKRDYAETYRLTRRKDGRSFLMKVYLPDEMPEDLKFKGKPSLIAYLNSSGISRQLSIAAWGEFNSPEGKTFPYIITDYFVRGPLSDILLTDGPMNALDAVNVCFDLAGILLNMHTPDGGNFVHCDICPDNIMFGYDENAELHARLIDHDHLRHCGENTAETGEHFWDDVDIRYTAPEAFCSEGIVSNTDVYSLGVILYECYYGAYPWPVDDEDIYEGSSTPRKMGMLMHARNNELPDYRKGDDKWEDMILSLVRLMTEYDYDEAAFTASRCWRPGSACWRQGRRSSRTYPPAICSGATEKRSGPSAPPTSAAYTTLRAGMPPSPATLRRRK